MSTAVNNHLIILSAQESAIVALKHTTRTEADDWFQLFGFDESRPTYKPGNLLNLTCSEYVVCLCVAHTG